MYVYISGWDKSHKAITIVPTPSSWFMTNSQCLPCHHHTSLSPSHKWKRNDHSKYAIIMVHHPTPDFHLSQISMHIPSYINFRVNAYTTLSSFSFFFFFFFFFFIQWFFFFKINKSKAHTLITLYSK